MNNKTYQWQLPLIRLKLNLSIYHAVVYSAVIYITGKSKVYLTAGDLPPAVCVWCKTVVVEVDGSVFHIGIIMNKILK